MGYSHVDKIPPDRNHPDFIDMVLTRCVLKYGFANGSEIAFEISNYLKGQHMAKFRKWNSPASMRVKCGYRPPVVKLGL